MKTIIYQLNGEFQIIKNNKATHKFNVSMKIYENSVTLIRGSNGSGKTTVFDHIFNVQSGHYHFQKNGLCHTTNLRDMYYVMQTIPSIENITYADVYKNLINKHKHITWDRVIAYFHDNNINEQLLHNNIGSLSGGETKIMEIIICYFIDYKMIFIDEINANLDAHKTQFVVKLIRQLMQRKIAVIFTSHDEQFMKNFHVDTIIDIVPVPVQQ